MSEDAPQYSPHAIPYPPLIPVLQVPREELRRGVRDTLFALHQERTRHRDGAGIDGLLAQIRFWEAVLGWIMEQTGDHVNLMGRPR